MNTTTTHSGIMDLIKQVLNEIPEEKLVSEEENSIRNKVVEKFNQTNRRKYGTAKEHYGRRDFIVEVNGKPALIYEFKKYLKPDQPIRLSEISDIKEDLGKLYDSCGEFSSCKTYFVLITSEQILKDAHKEDLEDMLNLENNVRKTSIIEYHNKKIKTSRRKTVREKNFCILSWEIYNK